MAGLIVSSIVSAQGPVEAELAFAKMAKESSVKQAFLYFADTSAAVFQQGKVLNAIRAWQRVPESGGQLQWAPVFAALSGAGDLGFTTGGFTFSAPGTDTIQGAGQYSTIWNKTTSGEWKFLADLGVSNEYTVNAFPALHVFSHLVPAPGTATVDGLEAALVKDLSRLKNKAYTSYIVAESWFNVDGVKALTDSTMILEHLSLLPDSMVFSPVRTGMSSSNDLGFVYGISMVQGKKENYLRIWGHTSSGWKILLQVIKK